MFLQVTITDVFNFNKCHTIILLVCGIKADRLRQWICRPNDLQNQACAHLTTHCSGVQKDSAVHKCQHIMWPFSPISVFIQLYYHPKGKLLYRQVLNAHRSQEHADNSVLYILMHNTPVSHCLFSDLHSCDLQLSHCPLNQLLSYIQPPLCNLCWNFHCCLHNVDTMAASGRTAADVGLLCVFVWFLSFKKLSCSLCRSLEIIPTLSNF